MTEDLNQPTFDCDVCKMKSVGDSCVNSICPAVAQEESPAYCAVRPGWPGFVAIMVGEKKNDTASDLKERAKELASWARRGYSIVRATRDDAVAGMHEYVEEKKRRGEPEPRRRASPKPARENTRTREDRELELYRKAMRGE